MSWAGRCGSIGPRALVTSVLHWALLAQQFALSGTTQTEILWSRLKIEEIEARVWSVFADSADAQARVADYFNYYDHERGHFSIDYMKSH